VITALENLRHPFSQPRGQLDGSDAMNPDPDYSAAYLLMKNRSCRVCAAHGFVFTIGRGN